jgi:hypothetical protein
LEFVQRQNVPADSKQDRPIQQENVAASKRVVVNGFVPETLFFDKKELNGIQARTYNPPSLVISLSVFGEEANDRLILDGISRFLQRSRDGLNFIPIRKIKLRE